MMPSPSLPVRAAAMMVSMVRSHVVVAQDDVDLNLGQQIHLIGGAAPREFDAALTAVAMHLVDVQADDADLAQRILDVLQCFFTDDCFYLLVILKSSGLPLPGITAG